MQVEITDQHYLREKRYGIAGSGLFQILFLYVILYLVVPKLTAETNDIHFQVISPLIKVRQTDEFKGTGAKQIELFAARGEAENAQILIQPDATLSNITCSPSILSDGHNHTITAEVRLVGYVPVSTPTPGGFGKRGLYPDPLLPMRIFDVSNGCSQSIWYSIEVESNTPPGNYHGSVHFAQDKASLAEIPVDVRIYPTILPKISFLKTCCMIWGYAHGRYGPNWTTQKDQAFLEEQMRYRLTSPPPLPWDTVFGVDTNGHVTAHWKTFDQSVAFWRNKGASFFTVRSFIFPWLGQPAGMNDPVIADDLPVKIQKLKLLDEHLVQNHWTKLFGIYLFDEPSLSPDPLKPSDKTGANNIKTIQAFASFFHEHAPHLRLMIVACDPSYKKLALPYPAYDWVPHINHFDPDFQTSRRAMGEQNWMYVCISTIYATNFPDVWRIDWYGTAPRCIGLWLWRYHCDGFLYWCSDYWTKDVYSDPMPYPGGNGDGFLFYPDPMRERMPFPSMRLEALRDGIEDYDLLTLLQQKLTTSRIAPSRAAQARAVFARLDEIIKAPDNFDKNPEDYASYHREILEALEALH